MRITIYIFGVQILDLIFERFKDKDKIGFIK